MFLQLGTQYCVAVTQETDAQTPNQRVAQRVRELRDARGWSARALSEELERAGHPQLNRSTVASIESGRRSYVTVDELFAFAEVLGTTPMALAGDEDPAEKFEEVLEFLYKAATLLAVARQGRGLLDEIEASGLLSEDEVKRRSWLPLSLMRSMGDAYVGDELRRHADEKHGRA